MRYIDLGLPSGIKWSDFYTSGIYTYSSVLAMPEEQYRCFNKFLPTKDNFLELFTNCKVKYYKKGSINFLLLTGPNGNKIRMLDCFKNSGWASYLIKDGFFEDKIKQPKVFILSTLSVSILLSGAGTIFVKKNE